MKSDQALFCKNYIEIIETNRLDTALQDSRTYRRQEHSPPHRQGDTKSGEAMFLSKF